MASIKTTSFSLLFAIILIGFFPSPRNAEAKHQDTTGINPFCKPATTWRLCNHMVKDATNLHDASLNAINTAIYVAKKIQSIIPLVVRAVSDLPIDIQEGMIKVCNETIDDSVDDLQQALECFNNGDKGGADTHLSSAYRDECKEALKEEGESVPVLMKLDEQFYKVVDTTLAVVFQRYAGQMWGGP